MKPVWCGCYDFLTAKGNRQKFLETVKANGGYGIRIFGQYSKKVITCIPFNQVVKDSRIDDFNFSTEQRMCLEKKDGKWWFNRPENPNSWLPLYDLEDLREDYFLNLFHWGTICRILGLAIHIDLDDYVSLKRDGIDKYLHPYYCSIQALSSQTLGGVWGNPMKKYICPWWKKAIASLTESGVELYAYTMNEYDSKNNPDKQYLNWNIWGTDKLKKYGVPKNRLIASSSRLPQEIIKTTGFFSFHGIASPEAIPNKFPIQNNKCILSGDGGRGNGRPDAKGRKGSSVAQEKAIAKIILERNYAGREVLDRGLWRKNNDIANVDDFDPATLKSSSQILNQ